MMCMRTCVRCSFDSARPTVRRVAGRRPFLRPKRMRRAHLDTSSQRNLPGVRSCPDSGTFERVEACVATHADDVESGDATVEPEVGDGVCGETGQQVACRGADDEARDVGQSHTRIRACTARRRSDQVACPAQVAFRELPLPRSSRTRRHVGERAPVHVIRNIRLMACEAEDCAHLCLCILVMLAGQRQREASQQCDWLLARERARRCWPSTKQTYQLGAFDGALRGEARGGSARSCEETTNVDCGIVGDSSADIDGVSVSQIAADDLAGDTTSKRAEVSHRVRPRQVATAKAE
eukprot:20038-Prymnesium_polylepis.2